MLGDLSLKKIFDELTGISEVKPFECVGTPDEVVVAIGKYIKQNVYKPLLLNDITLDNLDELGFNNLISEYNTEHLIPEKFEIILKNALND